MAMKISCAREIVNREIRGYILTNLAYMIMTNHENTTLHKRPKNTGLSSFE